MSTVYGQLIPGLWWVWGLYWLIAAAGASPAKRRESMISRAAHLLPLAAALWLLWPPYLPGNWWFKRVLPSGWHWLAAGMSLVAGGLLFTVWARVHLGRHWSGTVTLKEGHELIRSGPYRTVRHPIYTGLLLAFVGSAIACGECRGVLAVLIVFAALWRKLRLEERWLGELFGAAYAAYRVEVKALLPFLL